MFLRFIGAYPGSRFVYAIQQDSDVLEMCKAEYYEAFQNFDESIIMEAVSRAKKIYGEPAKINELLPLVEAIQRDWRSKKEMEDRSKRAHLIENSAKSKEDEEARERISALLKGIRAQLRGQVSANTVQA
jgi:glucose-6-phosphate isomerase